MLPPATWDHLKKAIDHVGFETSQVGSPCGADVGAGRVQRRGWRSGGLRRRGGGCSLFRSRGDLCAARSDVCSPGRHLRPSGGDSSPCRDGGSNNPLPAVRGAGRPSSLQRRDRPIRSGENLRRRFGKKRRSRVATGANAIVHHPGFLVSAACCRLSASEHAMVRTGRPTPAASWRHLRTAVADRIHSATLPPKRVCGSAGTSLPLGTCSISQRRRRVTGSDDFWKYAPSRFAAQDRELELRLRSSSGATIRGPEEDKGRMPQVPRFQGIFR